MLGIVEYVRGQKVEEDPSRIEVTAFGKGWRNTAAVDPSHNTMMDGRVSCFLQVRSIIVTGVAGCRHSDV